MGETTRQAALEKLSKFTYKIGYPNRWRDYSALEVQAGDLLGNLRRAATFEYQRNIAKLGKPIDREEWLMTPQTVNAYYNPEMNEIVFPAAILQPPFFDVSAEDAVNYGGIGAVIGHEISHGFDDQGAQYDGDGNLKMWWTEEDRSKFEALGARLAAQYDRYEPVPGYRVNGKFTLGENIADLGGLTIAQQAYHLSLEGAQAPVIDDLSADQRIFMGWAQIWRRKYREENLLNRLKTDPHSPSEYRCNGVITNMPTFYSAFGVVETDRLYTAPAERIKIW
jgi:predicted metalloendopeptidase